MADELQARYEAVPYPGHCRTQTHPDRLAVIATLFGMEPAPVGACRVLELGCGDGGNLIPMAYGLEGSHFVGIDLAASAIAAGRAMASELGLGNLELRQGNILELGPELGVFDYVIAHGVYSWVPEPVREKLLAICRAHLAPQGVAFVSYNAYPGCHIRNMAREMMLFHVQGTDKPEEKVGQALALMDFLGGSQTQADEYRQFIKHEAELLRKQDREVIFHDSLAAINEPFYFHQFMRQAQAHGLQYLGEADYFEMQDHIYTPQVSQTLRRLAGNRILREQYLDFLKCRRFRQTLLCHREANLQASPRAETVKRFRVASMATPASPRPDLRPGQIERFEGAKDAAMETDFPLAKAAIQILGEIWPESLGFDELLRQARARLDSPADSGEDAEALAEILLQTYSTGLVEFHLHEPAHARQPSERPLASPLARLQIRRGAAVTTCRHETILVADGLAQKLLALLDGSRDRAALVEEMAAFARSQGVGVDLPRLAREIEQNLEKLARLGLLAG